MTDELMLHIVWGAFRKGMSDFIDSEAGKVGNDTEGEYRIRCEKAGLVAVINLVAKAYQTEEAA